MEFLLTSQNLFNGISNDQQLGNGNNFTYRTEVYLQQRERQSVNRSPPSTITTWKNLKYQKCIFDNDQEELDRVLSAMDSIHGTFNRSLLIPFSEIYSSLYGDDDKSSHLMKTFCQRQDHYRNSDLTINDSNGSTTQEISSSFGNFHDTDIDDDDTEDDEEEKHLENEKKYSYDSGYGSVIPMRPWSREPLYKVTRSLNIN